MQVFIVYTTFTYLLNNADNLLKPSMKNKKTVSRPAEKDFKATNVSEHASLDIIWIFFYPTRFI